VDRFTKLSDKSYGGLKQEDFLRFSNFCRVGEGRRGLKVHVFCLVDLRLLAVFTMGQHRP